MAKGKDLAGTSGDKSLSEVEHLLMRKTFTRVEFDRLTDLLRARTVEPALSAQVDHHEDKNETRTRIDGIGGSTSHGMAIDHSPPADVPIRDVKSPADLAKQYMSSRYSREPQQSSLRSQVLFGNKAESSNTGYYRTSGAPLVQELNQVSNENPGLPVNGYMASGLRGRSAICKMSRSPFFKGPSSSNDMNVSPFSLSHARTPSLAAGGRQVLKRRGTEFDNELGSVGPIRRIRQKSNMMSPFKDARASPRGNFLPTRTIGSDFAEGSSPHQEPPSSKRLLLESGQSLRTVERQRNSEGGKPSNDDVPPVPTQPNKMAEKIFEQLNIIAPSPKGKQSGQQSVAGKPRQSMSNGPKGVSDPSSSRQFQDLDGVNLPHDSDLNGSTLNKDKLMKDGSSKVHSITFHQDLGNRDMKSDHVAILNKPAISGNSVSATTSRKPGFKMAVFEDLTEFDDDLEAPVPSKNSKFETDVKATEQKFDSKMKERKVQHVKFEQKVESTSSEQNVINSSVTEQPRTSTSKDVSTPGLFSSSDTEKKGTPNVSSNNNTGFTFQHVSPADRAEGTVSAVPLASNKDDKQTSASPFMFGSKPSSTSDLETSTAAGVKTKGRLGESATKPASLDTPNLEKGNGREGAGDIHKSSDKELPTAAPTLTPPLHFASAASTSPGLSNGLSHTSPPKLSNTTPTDKPAVSTTPLTTIAGFSVSSSSPPVSSSVPAFPTINFGSSSPMVATPKPETTSTETKPASTSLFGTVGTTTESKSKAPESASNAPSNLNTSSIFSSNITTFSSSPVTSSSFSSTATFSSSPVASFSVGTAPANSTPSTTSGVQSASTAAFAFSSSGNSIFGFSSPSQSTGLSTTVGGSTSQPSPASTIFGSKPPQPQGTMSQPPQSSATQFSSSFPIVASGVAAASSSGPGTVSFGAGASPPGTLLFGAGASSSGPGTVSFGAGAASSGGPGSVSIGGASSSGTGVFSFGAGVSSSGPGTVSFGATPSSSGSGTMTFGGTPSSSGPGTVSFGVTTSSTGPVFGNSPFGSGAAAFSGSGSGFAFSSPSSSTASSLAAASTSMFSSSSTASSSAALSNPFGSASSSPSMFTFGQSASSGGAFSFGAQSAPAFSSQAPPVYSFTSASASMNLSTPQPAFGMTNANTGFGMGSPGNDQMSMEDSMADDTNQAAPPQVSAPVFGSSLFGQPASSPAAPIFGQPASSPATPVFGAPAAQPAGAFQFGGQQGSVQQNPAFPTGGSLEFQGGNFSLGSMGGDKSNRRIIKAKRTQKKR
uniref:Nuclear pore complex protein NUP1 n=1 Tax=Triticum urartu TaxID=4572 RepID=A0A8R7QLZ8_TRIUA